MKSLRKHWRYAKYLLRHKYYVFLECVRYGIPFAGITHDLTKLQPVEWFPYAETFYGPYQYDLRPLDLKYDFDVAWLHHQHRNKHHYQAWILREDDGGTKVLEMPLRYRKEMLADWIGAGRALGKYNEQDRLAEVRSWYLQNKENILLGKNTRIWIERELGLLENGWRHIAFKR